MVTITNGQMTLTVPNAAYEMMFRSSGFRVLADEEREYNEGDKVTSETEENTLNTPYDEENADTDEVQVDEEEEDEEEAIDLSEIPLSEMGFYQLCDYADQLGLDRTGIRSKKELRNLIRDNI